MGPMIGGRVEWATRRGRQAQLAPSPARQDDPIPREREPGTLRPMVGRVLVLLLLLGLVYVNFARLRRASQTFDDGEPDEPTERP